MGLFDVDNSGEPSAGGKGRLYTQRRQHKLLITTPVNTISGDIILCSSPYPALSIRHIKFVRARGGNVPPYSTFLALNGRKMWAK